MPCGFEDKLVVSSVYRCSARFLSPSSPIFTEPLLCAQHPPKVWPYLPSKGFHYKHTSLKHRAVFQEGLGKDKALCFSAAGGLTGWWAAS